MCVQWPVVVCHLPSQVWICETLLANTNEETRQVIMAQAADTETFSTREGSRNTQHWRDTAVFHQFNRLLSAAAGEASRITMTIRFSRRRRR